MPPGELDRGGTKSLTLQERPDPPRTPRGSGAHQTEVAVAPGLGGSPSTQRRQRLRRASAHGPGPPAPQALGRSPAVDGHRLARVAAVLTASVARRPFLSLHGVPVFGGQDSTPYGTGPGRRICPMLLPAGSIRQSARAPTSRGPTARRGGPGSTPASPGVPPTPRGSGSR